MAALLVINQRKSSLTGWRVGIISVVVGCWLQRKSLAHFDERRSLTAGAREALARGFVKELDQTYLEMFGC